MSCKSKRTRNQANAIIPKNQKPVAPKTPRHCEHIMTNGEFCRLPALRGRKHCHFHLVHLGRKLRAERRYDMAMKSSINSKYIPMDLPLLEDANSIQLALSHVVDALMNNGVDAKRAGLVLYALQTATLNMRNGVDFSQREGANVAESYDNFEEEFVLGDAAPELKLDEDGGQKKPAAAAAVAQTSPAIKPQAPASPPKVTAKPALPLDPASASRLMDLLPRLHMLRGGKTILRPANAGPG